MYDTSYTTTLSDEQVAGLASFSAVFLGIITVISIVAYLVFSFILGKVFQKAGKPMWAAFVPIYNQVVLLQIVNKPIWWILLFFIPFVNIVIIILIMLELGKVFGKDGTFSVLLLAIVPFITGLPIGLAILAFDKSKYTAPTQNGLPQNNTSSGSVPEILQSSNPINPQPSPQGDEQPPKPPQNLVK